MTQATPVVGAHREISALIEVLHSTERRLEELTAGEVDTVADSDGRTFLLRRAQDQLRSTDAVKQTAILNALPANIALLDATGVILSTNEAWRRFVNANGTLSPGHGIGFNYFDACDGATGDSAAKAHEAAAGMRSVLSGSATGFAMEYACHSPTQRRWFQLMVTPLVTDSRRGVVVMHLDVTPARESEENLRASELRFRQMAEKINDVFFLQSLDSSQVHYVSPAYEEIWGRTCESLYADPASWGDAIHPDDREQAFAKFTAGRTTGFDYEFRILRPDGGMRWIHVRGFPVRDESGNLYRTAGVASDITERKLAAEGLRQSESLKRAILESSLDSLVTIDHEGKIVEFNAAAEATFGRTRTQVLGKGIVDFIVPPRLRDAHRRGFAHYLATGEGSILGTRRELEAVRADGAEFPIELAITALRGTPKPMFTAVIRDITLQRGAAQDLRESERRFSTLLENVQLAAVMLDCEGLITYCNDYLLGLTGWRREEVMGQDWFTMFLPPELGDMKPFFWSILADMPKARHRDNDILTRAGKRRLIRWNNSLLRSGQGDVIGTASIGEDITDRREAETRIIHLNRVYAIQSGIYSLIMRVRDRDALFKEACQFAVTAGGFRMSWIGILEGMRMQIVALASDGVDEGLLSSIRNRFSAVEDATQGGTLSAQAITEQVAAVANNIQADSRVLFGYSGSGLRSMVILPLIIAEKTIGVFALYTGEVDSFHEEELKLLTDLAGNVAFAVDRFDKQERLDYLSYYDVLTGLANQRLFLERVAQCMRSAAAAGHNLALFLIDLERFKNINDSLGQPAGDALLRQVAEWLTHRAGGASVVARLGADHFAVVIPEVKDDREVTPLLEQALEAFLEHPFRLQDAVFRIAVKVGVALFPANGVTAEVLFSNAEAALKEAKSTGQRYLFYTQKMTETVAGKVTLENQLRQALENDEFVLHYQPKINIQSGKLTSAEALIRWNDPRTGLVPPGKFIPILEETGLIHEVGRWAMRKAIQDYLRWRAAGLNAVRIAVNVSPLQLRNRGFIAEIEEIVGVDKQAAAGLELEITESLIMEDVKHSIASLQAIRAMGVTIAIDDFGTGFSSLNYLSKLPVDTLKIDRSFVVEMTIASEGLALVSTIIGLAHSLKLKVVAEGVETEEQSRLLRLLNCDELQGFLFSKAVPTEIFEAKFLASPQIV